MQRSVAFEEVDRLRLGVDDPDLVLHWVIADVSDLLASESDSLEALLPYDGSVKSVCPEVCACLSTHKKHVILVPRNTLDTAVAVVGSLLYAEDLHSLLVVRSLHDTDPVALATHVEVACSRIDGDRLHIKRLLELLLYLTLEADLREHTLVAYAPEE